MIELLDKRLSASDKQWAMLNVLCQLAQVDGVDFALWNPVTDKWMEILGNGLCTTSIEQALKKCRGMNKDKGEDIMVRPERWKPASIILLDDLSLSQAKALVAKGYNHILIVTSIDPVTKIERTHLWIQTDRLVNEQERRQIQEVLIGEFGSDEGCKSGEHFGRLNGVRNHKRGGQWVNLHQYRLDGRALPTDELLAAHPSNRPHPPTGAGVGGGCGSPLPPGGSVLVLFPLAVVPSTPPAPAQPPKAQEKSGYNPESRNIWACTCECLKKGVPDSSIIKQIAPRILSSGIRRTEKQALKEAEDTVEKAKIRLGLTNIRNGTRYK